MRLFFILCLLCLAAGNRVFATVESVEPPQTSANSTQDVPNTRENKVSVCSLTREQFRDMMKAPSVGRKSGDKQRNLCVAVPQATAGSENKDYQPRSKPSNVGNLASCIPTRNITGNNPSPSKGGAKQGGNTNMIVSSNLEKGHEYRKGESNWMGTVALYAFVGSFVYCTLNWLFPIVPESHHAKPHGEIVPVEVPKESYVPLKREKEEGMPKGKQGHKGWLGSFSF